MSAHRSRVMPVVALLAAFALTGCVTLPDGGGVRTSDEAGAEQTDALIPYDPRPPQPGETPVEIVRHFLDAMLATPMSTVVARQFLTTQAQSDWRPDQQMITYEDFEAPMGSDRVELRLRNAHALDAAGRWAGDLTGEQSRFTFEMALEDGEWRIASLPNATIVSDEFFAARFQQLSLYFFDESGQILVPEPAFVPRGEQLSTTLVRGLLRGPGTELDGVAESFIPDDMVLDLSVPVEDGTASVSLRGEASNLDAEQAQRIAVQLAWTLRQDPTVRRVQLVVNDAPLALEDSSTLFDVDLGREFDPAGDARQPGLVGLRDGRLVTVTGDRENSTTGPFGRSALGLDSVVVDLRGARAVAVAGGGTTLLEGPARDVEGEGARTLLAGAGELLPPVWDHAERIWVLDRGDIGAAVSVIADGRNTPVEVPGITGEDVTAFLVSHDGTRLAAVVRTGAGDVVRVSRLSGVGHQVSATSALQVSPETESPIAIRDIGWQSPTRILVLQSVSEGLSQVNSVPVDGSPATSSARPEEGVIREEIVRLVSTPVTGMPVLGVDDEGGVHELGSENSDPVPESGLASLGYVG